MMKSFIINSKIHALQNQVAMLSLTIVSMRVHLEQLDQAIETLKPSLISDEERHQRRQA